MVPSRSSSKRAQSPVVVPEDAPMCGQVDGSCFGKPDAAEAAVQDAKDNKVKTTAADNEDDKQAATSPAIPSFLKLTEQEYKDKYAELNRMEQARLDASEKGGEWARMDPDPVLDRYNNIHPWDNNRIKLQVPEGINDYINASPVTLVSTAAIQSTIKAGIQDKYICMQGPKKETVDHVWHMIWHELAIPYNSSPGVIIMLSPTHGPSPNDPTKMFEKCYPYYPVDENSPPLIINDKDELGPDFKATVRFVQRLPGISGTALEVRQLEMIVEPEEGEEPDEPKTIWHYLYPNWPDFGALAEENVAAILAIMEISRRENGRGENARVVHCSAGVGRTGTFVALEFLIGELEGGAWEGWDETDKAHTDPIFETVNQLRIQRKTMVQAYEQYAFLYEVLRKLWEEKYKTPCVGGEHKN